MTAAETELPAPQVDQTELSQHNEVGSSRAAEHSDHLQQGPGRRGHQVSVSYSLQASGTWVNHPRKFVFSMHLVPVN